jgi:hypothetical protein
MRRVFLLIAVLALALAACKAEVNLSIDVDEDGRTEVSAEIGADEEFQQLISAGGGGDPGDLLGEGLDFNLEDGESYERTEGEMTFWGARKEFTSYEDLTGQFADPADPDSPFTDFSFTMDDEEATLDATIVAPEQEIGTDEIPFDPSQITSEIFSVNFIFGMPGTVVEHNADEVLADGRLLWEIPLVGGEKEIFARSEFGSSAMWWLWLILGIVLVAGITAAIVAVLMSRRQAEKAVAAASVASSSDVPSEATNAPLEPAETPGDGDEGVGSTDDED